jgi:hypothetical protein
MLYLFSYHVLTNRQVVQDKCAIVVKPSVLHLFYSPTVNPISLFILLAKAATLPQYSISAYDVKGAFLNSPEDTHVYVRVDEELSKMFTGRYPVLEKHLNDNATLTFRLRRYLYRLQDSPSAWNKLSHQKLEQMKFKRSSRSM